MIIKDACDDCMYLIIVERIIGEKIYNSRHCSFGVWIEADEECDDPNFRRILQKCSRHRRKNTSEKKGGWPKGKKRGT